MASLVVETTESVRLRREIAGAGSRLAAGLLDGLLLAAGYLTLLASAFLVTMADPTGISGLVTGVLVGGAVLIVIGYHVAFHLAWQGRTPGKAVLGVRVVSADGHPASALQLVLRGCLWIVDVGVLVPLPLGLLLCAATERHQRLGDLAAGTLVVRDERARARPEPFAGKRWSTLETGTLALSPGLAARLSADDVEFLRDLWTRTELEEEPRRELFVRAARHYSAKLGLGEFADARVLLEELYLFAREHREARAPSAGRAGSAAS